MTLNPNTSRRNMSTTTRHDEIKERSRTDAPLYKPTLCILERKLGVVFQLLNGLGNSGRVIA